jgi:hypothetical protein
MRNVCISFEFLRKNQSHGEVAVVSHAKEMKKVVEKTIVIFFSSSTNAQNGHDALT